MAGIFGASGQSCVAGSRLYLQDSIAEQFLDGLVRRARAIRIGDPMLEETEMGPLATLGQIAHIEANVAKAQQQGGTVLTGGRQPREHNSGWFYEPTIVDCPRQDLQIVGTELFGPVLSVLRFTSEEEVLSYANDSEYGLAAGIFTRDSARAMRMAKAVHSGIVWMNTYRMVSPMAEFGGFKNSGHGREAGMEAVYDYTRTKTLWLNTSDKPMANPFVMR
jgi:aldehyde dehydrogenase (NAD+)